MGVGVLEGLGVDVTLGTGAKLASCDVGCLVEESPAIVKHKTEKTQTTANANTAIMICCCLVIWNYSFLFCIKPNTIRSEHYPARHHSNNLA
jgi:hypothetical protein